MPVPDFSPGEVLTASAMDSIGLWLVKTHTITGSASTVDVTSCFSSDYSNYRIVFDSLVTSGAVNLSLRFLVGSSSTDTGYYTSYFDVSLGGTVAGGGQTDGTSALASIIGNTVSAGGVIEVYGPNKANRTSFTTQGIDTRTNGSPMRQTTGFQNSNTQFNGFRLLTLSAVTFTSGVIRVYGYRD